MTEPPMLSPSLRALQLQLQAMPPVAAMQVEVVALDQQGLSLRAPLAANINDKGNAFGGSLTSLMTLAGWSWLSVQLRAADEVAELYVADSQVRYLLPVYEDLRAWAGPIGDDPATAQAAAAAFVATLRERGKARITLQAQVVLRSGEVAACLQGRFVALAKR